MIRVPVQPVDDHGTDFFSIVVLGPEDYGIIPGSAENIWLGTLVRAYFYDFAAGFPVIDFDVVLFVPVPGDHYPAVRELGAAAEGPLRIHYRDRIEGMAVRIVNLDREALTDADVVIMAAEHIDLTVRGKHGTGVVMRIDSRDRGPFAAMIVFGRRCQQESGRMSPYHDNLVAVSEHNMSKTGDGHIRESLVAHPDELDIASGRQLSALFGRRCLKRNKKCAQ